MTHARLLTGEKDLLKLLLTTHEQRGRTATRWHDLWKTTALSVDALVVRLANSPASQEAAINVHRWSVQRSWCGTRFYKKEYLGVLLSSYSRARGSGESRRRQAAGCASLNLGADPGENLALSQDSTKTNNTQYAGNDGQRTQAQHQPRCEMVRWI